MPDVLLQPEEFIVALRRIGAERYHDRHPFHRLLNDGHCTMAQVRAWVLNRFYYQSRIPLKDAALIARAEDPALRREWRSRLEEHDGADGNPGGIERWLVLAEAVGLDRGYVVSTGGVPPDRKGVVSGKRGYDRVDLSGG